MVFPLLRIVATSTVILWKMSTRPLSENDIEAELSYAYLHAVAARAGVACEARPRLADNRGIDALLTAWGPWPGVYREEVYINVQLKATTNEPADDGSHLSYFLKETNTSTRYDDLRQEAIAIPRILVVLFLPKDSSGWLTHSADQLALKRCAYWVNLRGAPPSSNRTGVTVKLPKANEFGPDGLTQLVLQLAKTPRDKTP